MSSVTRVGIAVVEHRGRYLVGTRGADLVLAGKAEFPGGKAEREEDPQVAAVRECREETGLAVTATRLLHQVRHTYDHGTVELFFWLCQPLPTAEVVEELNGFRWLTPAEMRPLDWPAANRAVLEELRVES
ncbi:(deoxy)nucleoside triphosphate pyrophosphohydrolase [Planctellipticum variicoloris]|uniref:(deoxy)nucleoside triphosphate pyrophosphohydrolase n=1 Tax=Planctellipticum variicoloris TaxID=3064265 RepID=UPI0030133BF3|nr:NUDIX domain-containing protein [Planctomycetaceae bacterium SH412]